MTTTGCAISIQTTHLLDTGFLRSSSTSSSSSPFSSFSSFSPSSAKPFLGICIYFVLCICMHLYECLIVVLGCILWRLPGISFLVFPALPFQSPALFAVVGVGGVGPVRACISTCMLGSFLRLPPRKVKITPSSMGQAERRSLHACYRQELDVNK